MRPWIATLNMVISLNFNPNSVLFFCTDTLDRRCNTVHVKYFSDKSFKYLGTTKQTNLFEVKILFDTFSPKRDYICRIQILRRVTPYEYLVW